MGIFEFLDTLERTLNTIEVKGKENLDALYSSLMAIDSYRQSVKDAMLQAAKQQAEAEKEETPVDGGGEVGRQSDIGTESSSGGNGE